MKPNPTQQKLDQLAKQIKEGKVCPELAKTAANLVFGEGNPEAAIMFIGEAPGKDEDIQGRPFVGAAGRLLGKMLETIGLKREEVYITNIIKYRPPANRDPLPEEVKAFLPYLLKQIETIKPKLIVTLGRFSLNVFFPKLKISQVHGQPKRIRIRKPATPQSAAKLGSVSGSAREQDKQTLVILPLYHPAVALYDNSKQQTLEEDFIKIPKVVAII